MSEPFRILVVCSGNVCRSPLAERLLRAKLDEAFGADGARVRVTSAGTGAVVGAGMDPRAAAVAWALGADPDGFVARSIEAAHVAGADLVLGAAREHRAAAVGLHPPAHRYAFTVLEFARLAAAVPADELPAGDPVTRAMALVAAAAAGRGLRRAARPELDDVPDPHRGQDRVHREVGAVLDAALSVLVDVVAGREPAPAAVGPSGADSPVRSGRAVAGRSRAAGTGAAGARGGDRRRPGAAAARGGGRGWPEPAHRVARDHRRVRTVLVRSGLGGLALLALGLGWVVLRGVQAQRELVAVRSDVTVLRTAVLAGDLPTARLRLADIQHRTARARRLTGDPVWRTAGAAPYAGATIGAVHTLSVAADDLATGALPTLVETAAALDPARLRPAGDQVSLAGFTRAAPALAAARADLLSTRDRLAGLDSEQLLAPVAAAVVELRAQLADTAATLDRAGRASRLAPSMLGAGGTRRYLVVFQNNAEARATGGLVGAYALVTAQAGRLRVLKVGSNTDLRGAGTLPVDLGRDFRANWGDAPALWQNGNLDANFPNAARIWLALWKKQTGQSLDGVVATDPVALAYLLRATGPVRLGAGESIDAGNAVRLTMHDVYARSADDEVRNGYLRSVAGRVVEALVAGRGAPRAVLDQLGRAAAERRLMVYSAHAAEQRDITGTAVSGLLSGLPGPYAYVSVNNAAGNKMDYYLRRSLRYDAGTCTGGTRTSRLTIVLGNTAPDPATLPEYVSQRLDDSAATRSQSTSDGSVVDLVSVYGPLDGGVLRATLDGRPLSLASGRSGGRPVWTFPLVVGHGTERTVVLEILEPATGGPPVVPVQPLVQPAAVSTSTKFCG